MQAVGSNSAPDFTEEQKAEAEELLKSENIIQKCVVSDAHSRSERFEETNLEILRASDVVLCLIREGTEGRIGGTRELLNRVIIRGKPVLELKLKVEEGKPKLTEQWHNLKNFNLPELPPLLSANTDITQQNDIRATSNLICIKEYTERVKKFASDNAKQARWNFAALARTIVYTHVTATVFATLVVLASRIQMEGLSKIDGLVKYLLVGEVLLLVCGIIAHYRLHHKKISSIWAFSRLTAEITRSIMAIKQFSCQLNYILNLPLPAYVRPLLRTMNILNLRSARANINTDWTDARATYIEKRLIEQQKYYQKHMDKEKSKLKNSKRLFMGFSLFAVLATLSKLLIKCYGLSSDYPIWSLISDALGFIAIVSPVIAMGAVSLAAALDLDARVHTYEEMFLFLVRQKGVLNSAVSRREFEKLVLETESHLLGETANWFTRRSYTEVA
ncbi:MAG: hypothetical protein D8M57_19365 [Candidatus Scalindua sp. AMX11]|nr:hypothetical protein [Planctomycetota bacterium]RZV61481.1 MAG: hypothetical protein EX341_18860 [Candidatus Scalindua sp. SCAELEC01]TDE63232.1 MAG: hypothetical protein D8M57_19365 [Candidatus Scalindua sp. AMX11]